MLIRLIANLSLFKFMLLLISGSNPDVALYKSILVFMFLFTVVYLGTYFLNSIRGELGTERITIPEMNSNKTQTKKEI